MEEEKFTDGFKSRIVEFARAQYDKGQNNFEMFCGIPIGSSPLKLKDTTIMGLPRQLTMSPNCNSEVFMLFLPGCFAGRNIVFIRRCYLFCTLLRFDRINSTDCYSTIFVFVQIQPTFFLLWSEEKIKT